MALTKYYQKISEKEVAVKVYGDSGSVTLPLVDFLTETQIQDGDLKVAITSLVWTGNTDGVITVKRNNVTISTLQANAGGMLEMSGQMMLPDDVESDSDFEISVNGIQCELWMRLRKVSGYKSTINIGANGVYDTPPTSKNIIV